MLTLVKCLTKSMCFRSRFRLKIYKKTPFGNRKNCSGGVQLDNCLKLQSSFEIDPSTMFQLALIIIFYLFFVLVIAVDLSEKMLAMAKNNAKVYGVDGKITFVHTDAFDWLEKQSTGNSSPVDAIFASPPWGGPSYIGRPFFDLNLLTFDRTSKSGVSGTADVWDLVRLMSKCVRNSAAPLALFLPRNTNIGQLLYLQRIALEASKGMMLERTEMEVELALIHKKAKALTVYLHCPVKSNQLSNCHSDSNASSDFDDGFSESE